MLVRDENGNFETTATSKLTINEEFEKSRHCPIMDANNNHDTNNNNAQLVATGDDVSMIDRSSIKSFYRNACILVTGGTGFVGKVLLEKLLRTCDNLQCIYVLLRSKRGRSSEERYHELIQNPVIFQIDPIKLSEHEMNICVRVLSSLLLFSNRFSIEFVQHIRSVCKKSCSLLVIFQKRISAYQIRIWKY